MIFEHLSELRFLQPIRASLKWPKIFFIPAMWLSLITANLIFTIYAHLSKIEVKAGQQIEKGQQIGLTGATGRVSGPHLHWGVKVNGTAVNPIQFIKVMDSLISEQE